MLNDKINNLINNLLALDYTKNIISIELQSDTLNSIEINVVYDNYDEISDEIWEYTLSFDTPEFQIYNFGIDQEIPVSKEILYRRGN